MGGTPRPPPAARPVRSPRQQWGPGLAGAAALSVWPERAAATEDGFAVSHRTQHTFSAAPATTRLGADSDELEA